MPKLTPAEAASKWQRNLKNATQDIQRGVQAVTVSPTEKAAAKIDKMRTNLIAAIDDGKVEAGLRRVTLAEWKDKTLNKGLQRLSAGVDAAGGKQQQFYTQLFPYQESLQGKVSGMPDTTLEDNIGRMVEWARGMSQFRRS
jgi:hypothetical protein